MLKQTRHERIVELLSKSGSVEIKNLCRLFDVTEMTIRRDLDEIVEQGLAVRTHGGAILADNNTLIEQPFEVRVKAGYDKKDAIARKALEYIQDGTKNFFNSSSTVFCLARRIEAERSLIIVTEAINIAYELNSRNNVVVIQIGGELRKNTISCIGYFAENMISQLHFDAAFIGVNAIDQEGNLYCRSTYEIGIYKKIFSSSKKIIVMADSSKIGVQDFSCIGHIKETTVLITDNESDKDILKKYSDYGVEVVIAPI